jgi:hypothetical protein
VRSERRRWPKAASNSPRLRPLFHERGGVSESEAGEVGRLRLRRLPTGSEFRQECRVSPGRLEISSTGKSREHLRRALSKAGEAAARRRLSLTGGTGVVSFFAPGRTCPAGVDVISAFPVAVESEKEETGQ